MPDAPVRPLYNLTVLVVDDEPAIRKLLILILEEAGALVTAVGSAPEARIAFEQQVPDLLITDRKMPEEDGPSLLASLRELPAERGGRVPTILLTGTPMDRDCAGPVRAQFDLELGKPISPVALVRHIVELLAWRPREQSGRP